MNKILSILRSHPYISNVLGYTTLFASADLIQQGILGGRAALTSEKSSTYLEEDASEHQASFTSVGNESGTKDEESRCGIKDKTTYVHFLRNNIEWDQTARIALIGLCFHSNFNYYWLRTLEKLFPGGGMKRISVKVFLDQLIAAPATISAFYVGLSTLEGKEDPFEDWQMKFWTSYKTGIVYWSIMQAVNFSLVPPVARTVFVGGISLGWTVFLCHFRQQRN